MRERVRPDGTVAIVPKIKGQKPNLISVDEGTVWKPGAFKRDKRQNTEDFNKKAKTRRDKSKQAAKSRKTNRRK